jgi:hypothetical protein
VLLLEWKLPPLCFIVFVSVLGSFAFPGSVSHHSFLLTPCIFVFSFVPPCSPFIFFLFVPPCFLFLSSSLLPLFPSCTVFALFLLFDPPPYSFFFFVLFLFKKTLPIARECHAVTQIIKSLWDCYCRSLKFYRR